MKHNGSLNIIKDNAGAMKTFEPTESQAFVFDAIEMYYKCKRLVAISVTINTALVILALVV